MFEETIVYKCDACKFSASQDRVRPQDWEWHENIVKKYDPDDLAWTAVQRESILICPTCCENNEAK